MTRILAALAAVLLAGAASAQYPNKPIRLIVPFRQEAPRSSARASTPSRWARRSASPW